MYSDDKLEENWSKFVKKLDEGENEVNQQKENNQQKEKVYKELISWLNGAQSEAKMLLRRKNSTKLMAEFLRLVKEMRNEYNELHGEWFDSMNNTTRPRDKNAFTDTPDQENLRKAFGPTRANRRNP